MRIFYINPYGFGSDIIDKIEQLKKNMIDYKIDAVMMSLPNRRWIVASENRMVNQLRSINQ